MIVRLTARAEADLEAIGDHIAQDDSMRALGFLAELRGRCAALAEFPKRFPLVPRYRAAGVRRCVHGDYLIFYRVGEAEVTIIHILHGAMDYEAVLAQP